MGKQVVLGDTIFNGFLVRWHSTNHLGIYKFEKSINKVKISQYFLSFCPSKRNADLIQAINPLN